METITQERQIEIDLFLDAKLSNDSLKRGNLEMLEKIKNLELRIIKFVDIYNYFNKEGKSWKELLKLSEAEKRRKLKEKEKAKKEEIKKFLIELKSRKKTGMNYVGINQGWIETGSGKWKKWVKTKNQLNFSPNKVKNKFRFELKNVNLELAAQILETLNS